MSLQQTFKFLYFKLAAKINFILKIRKLTRHLWLLLLEFSDMQPNMNTTSKSRNRNREWEFERESLLGASAQPTKQIHSNSCSKFRMASLSRQSCMLSGFSSVRPTKEFCPGLIDTLSYWYGWASNALGLHLRDPRDFSDQLSKVSHGFLWWCRWIPKR